jgi:GNAT superfamily N-acetyltransferase
VAANRAIKLRVVGEEDWSLWRKLRLEALAEASYAFSSTLADWQREGDKELRWRDRLSAVALNVVADLNGTAAGMVSATSKNQEGTIELISMWVAPFARGHGIGDALVAAVVEWARPERATRIALAVVESNEHAVRLYRRHRFVDVGPIDSIGSGVASERQMVRELRI